MTAPNLALDPSLPIAAHAAEIAGLILAHPVVIVAGETGSGKTTQLPKLCLALGREQIGHTQPRRIAARTVAERVAQEIGQPLGQTVGYQVRFTAQTSAATQLKVMTDGILLAEIAHDRQLRRYDTIIVDEAHERSLNIDFLLGYLKQLLPSRPDLKVIVTSATIDTERFSAHFDRAPIVEVSGRTYPVDVRYRPVGDADPLAAIVAGLRELPRQGDVLVFLSGERDIKDAAKAIAAAHLGVDILPLFARLSLAEQARVFQPHAGQRVVLATNVAETSLTVPGIRYVIDPGLARISRYSARTKVQRLPIEPISRASADQRAGRCGRVAPGICLRLYTEADYRSRPAYTEPEILRTNLAAVILAMANARLGDMADFPFIEAPDQSHIADGLRLLRELGAITPGDGEVRLTRVGRQLAQLPIDPRLGRMVLAGAERDCLREVLVLVAGLAIQDVRERPLEQRAAADALHARFASDDILGQAPAADEPAGAAAGWSHGPPAGAATGLGGSQAGSQAAPTETPARITPHTGWRARPPAGVDALVDPGGDFTAMLRLWGYLKRQRQDLGASQFRRLCQREYINYPRLREWQDLVTQLRQFCRDLKLPLNAAPAASDDILTACLTGLLSNIGAIEPPATGQSRRGRPGLRQYSGARGAHFALSPGSVLAHHPPELVMAVELVDTTRLWAQTVAGITVQQVEAVGADLIKRRQTSPYFSAKSGTVLAHEQVSLLGVVLAADRRVGYAAIDPVAARAIFLQSGLVENGWQSAPGTAYRAVWDHNQAVRRQVESLEDRARRRDLMVSDQELSAWFDARLPAEVVSGATLDRWLRADRRHGELLRLEPADLMAQSGAGDDGFPDVFSVGAASFGLDYHFAPGDHRDGLTVRVPLAQLASLDPAPFTWGVPGNRLALVTELIRGLPKAVRTQFVPAPDWAKRALAWLGEHGGDTAQPITDELTRALRGLTGVTVTGWRPQALPDHLRLGFAVATGGDEHFSRDLTELQAGLGHEVEVRLRQSNPRPDRGGTTWVFDDLPTELTLTEHGVTATAYPGLHDETSRVAEVLWPRLEEAKRRHRRGLIRLALLNLPSPKRWIVGHLSNQARLVLGAGPYTDLPALLDDAQYAAVAELIDQADPWAVRDQAGFEALLGLIRPHQVERSQAIVQLAVEVLRRAADVERSLASQPDSSWTSDINQQLRDLVFAGFLRTIPPPWLERLPVYLRAIELRLESAARDPRRDQARQAELDEVLAVFADWASTQPAQSEAVAQVGYLIEEWRVQLFAQQLRTSQPVSAKRLRQAMAEAR